MTSLIWVQIFFTYTIISLKTRTVDMRVFFRKMKFSDLFINWSIPSLRNTVKKTYISNITKTFNKVKNSMNTVYNDINFCTKDHFVVSFSFIFRSPLLWYLTGALRICRHACMQYYRVHNLVVNFFYFIHMKMYNIELWKIILHVTVH